MDATKSYKITDLGLAHLTSVHTLDLSGCILITDQGLDHLKGIHKLDLHGCKKITDNGLAKLKEIHLFKNGLENSLNYASFPTLFDTGVISVDLNWIRELELGK